MENNYRITIEEQADRFKVTCWNEANGERIPYSGILTFENDALIRQKYSGADPLGELVGMMKKVLAIWRAKGLI